MQGAFRLLVALALILVGLLVGKHGLKRMQPTATDEVLGMAERVFERRAPSSWKSDKSEAYLLLGVALLCVVAGVGVLASGGTGDKKGA